MTTRQSRDESANLGGVRRGYVLVGALLFGVAVMAFGSTNQGKPIWQGFAQRHALLYAGHEDPERFGANAGAERIPDAVAPLAEAPDLPHWSDPSSSMAPFFSELVNSVFDNH